MEKPVGGLPPEPSYKRPFRLKVPILQQKLTYVMGNEPSSAAAFTDSEDTELFRKDEKLRGK